MKVLMIINGEGERDRDGKQTDKISTEMNNE